MKTAFVLLAVCIIGLVKSEGCKSGTTGDALAKQCSHLTCANGWHLTCDSTVCTCVENSPDSTKCASLADCTAVANWDCPTRRRHCIDNICRCFRH